MFRALHTILTWMFVLLPGAMVLFEMFAGRSARRGRPSPAMALTWCGGVVIGGSFTVVFGLLAGARVGWGQLLLAIYFATGMLMVLKGIDVAVRIPVEWLWVRARRRASGRRKAGVIDLPFAFTRVFLIFALGVPYLVACVATYRPKAVPGVDPQTFLSVGYDRIDFRTADGLTLCGWWIPSHGRDKLTARHTVLFCHGFGAGKSSVLPMAKPFVAAGYNVLLFDFRAHGESDGQLTAFGAAERRDVRAAARWARERHADRTERLFGVGIDFGAAALIESAGGEGDRFDAVASVGGFDRFPALAGSLLRQYFLRPLDRYVGVMGTPVAGALAGEDLARFAPATKTSGLWPSPIFFLHAEEDEIVPFEHGQDLAKAASQPKRRFWTRKQSHRQLAEDEEVAKMIIEFFLRARPDPVI